MPNPSTVTTSTCAPSPVIRHSGGGSVTRLVTATGSPASSSGSPAASRAATGMKMSRPWNVAAVVSRHSARLVSETARAAPPAAATATDSRPLSGPTKSEPPASTATPAPRRPHSRVHDRHVHGGRKVGYGLGEDRGAAPDVAKRDQMCYVSNL